MQYLDQQKTELCKCDYIIQFIVYQHYLNDRLQVLAQYVKKLNALPDMTKRNDEFGKRNHNDLVCYGHNQLTRVFLTVVTNL